MTVCALLMCGLLTLTCDDIRRCGGIWWACWTCDGKGGIWLGSWGGLRGTVLSGFIALTWDMCGDDRARPSAIDVDGMWW